MLTPLNAMLPSRDGLTKILNTRSEGTKYHNREVKGIIGNQRIARGYSRATSDSVMNAYTKLGESFKATESFI